VSTLGWVYFVIWSEGLLFFFFWLVGLMIVVIDVYVEVGRFFELIDIVSVISFVVFHIIFPIFFHEL